MKKFILLVLSLGFLSSSAFADTGVFGGYIVLNVNGGGSTFYKLENPADVITPPFSSVNFGLFDPSWARLSSSPAARQTHSKMGPAT